MKLKYILWTAVAVVTVAALAIEADAETGAVRIGADVDAGTLDPRLMRDTTAYRVNNLLYDGLVQLDASLQPVPDLAVSWENPEPTVWVFNLRDGVKFHDGHEFNAEDVVVTFETILDPELNARFRSLYTPISKIEAVDDLTVRIELTEPYAPLLSYMDLGIAPAHVLQAGGDLSSEPVGTGPLRLSQWDRGSKIVLEPFADYWAGAPARGIEFIIVSDNTARAQAFEAGDLDIIQSPLSPQDIGRLVADDDFANHVTGGLGITYLNFNTADPMLADPRMRRALASFVDQETIVGQIFEGVDQVATSILLPSSWAFTDEIQQPSFNPERGKAMLGQLGWSDSDGDGVLDRDGQKLEIVVSTHSEDPNRIQSVEYLQNLLASNGIAATIGISDWPSFSSGVQNGQHQIALLGWLNIVDPDRLMYGQLHCEGGLNWGGYCNSNVSGKLDTGRSSLDVDQRIAAYQDAAATIAEEVPYYVISYQGYQVFYDPAIEGYEPNPRGMMRSLVTR